MSWNNNNNNNRGYGNNNGYGNNANNNGYGNKTYNNNQGNRPAQGNSNGNKMESVGGLWIRKTKNGGDMFSIIIDGKRYIALPNNYKTEDKHPDFKLFVSEDRPQQGQQNAQQGYNKPQYGQGQQPRQQNTQQSYQAPQKPQYQPPAQQQQSQATAPEAPANNYTTDESFDDIPTF